MGVVKMSSAGKSRLSKKVSTPTTSRSTSSSKSAKKKSTHTCPVCDDEIIDDTDAQRGQDSVFCDGACSTWLHRGCAGVSKQLFINLEKSDKPFHCVSCRLNIHSSEIDILHKEVNRLSKELSELKSLVTSSRSHSRNEVSKPSDACSPSISTEPVTKTTSTSPSSAHHKDISHRHHENRKFNILVFGIQECKQGLHYKQRFASDLHNVSTLFSKSSSKIPSSAIKDCRRLGKFNPDSVRPRPILVRFNTCAAVLDILANRSSFSPYIIKPDQSPQERTREKILLKERWNLCQSGVNKSSIKIKGNSLIVHDHLFGKVNKDSVFTIVRTDPTPPSNNSTTPSSCDSNSTTPSSLPPEGSMTTPMATNSPSHC